MVGCAGRRVGSSATTAATSSRSRSPGSSTDWCCSTTTGAGAAGQAVERHDLRAAGRAAGARARHRSNGRRSPAACRSHRSRSRSWRGSPSTSRRCWSGDARDVAARLPDLAVVRGARHRPRRHFRDRMVRPVCGEYHRQLLDLAVGRAWAGGCPRARRRPRSPARSEASRWPSSGSAARCSWRRAAATTWAPRSDSDCAAATWRSRSARPAPCSRCRRPPRATHPGRSPASPARAARSCRSCARSTRPR